MRQAQTKNHILIIWQLRNGDDLVFFPKSNCCFMGPSAGPRCVVEEHYEYPVTQLPYYKSPLPESRIAVTAGLPAK